MTKQEFLDKYSLTDEDFKKALIYAQSNESGTEDIQFHVNEDLDLTIEYNRKSATIINIYER